MIRIVVCLASIYVCSLLRSPKKKFEHKSGNSLFPVLVSLRIAGMDIGTSSFASQNSLHSVAQRKFYQWVLKWRNGINTSADANIEESRDVRNSNKPDVPTLASFLQAIGFKLLSLEKRNGTERKDEKDPSTPDPGVITVAIECGSSNMKAILELGDITCRCPHSDHVKDASFWTISGTGPANISPAAVISPYKPSRANTIGNVKPRLRLSQQHQLSTKPNFGNAEQSSKARRSIQIEQGNPRPPIRRNSSYVPSSANSNVPSLSRTSDVGQKLLGTELRVGSSQNLDTNNTPSKRTTSMIKPPTKITKAIPIKAKTVQPSKISTGLVKKPKITITKE